ncbi:MAG TPA: HAD hydrolase family protein [Pirellulales bacterium]
MTNLADRCRRVKLLICDVDGVLTDGSINLSTDGVETKRFHVRDGSAIKLWTSSGGRIAWVSGRKSAAVERRAEELGVTILFQGVSDKLPVVRRILADLALTEEEYSFIGDDLPDLPAVSLAGLGVAVADAVPELRTAADYVTDAPGGTGAVRETIEMLLKAQGAWDAVVARYSAQASG